MAESFTITAIYKNKQTDFEASFVPFGFSYRIEVLVDGVLVFFEPDEEKNYRAWLPDALNILRKPDTALVQAIAQALEKAFNT